MIETVLKRFESPDEVRVFELGRSLRRCRLHHCHAEKQRSEAES